MPYVLTSAAVLRLRRAAPGGRAVAGLAVELHSTLGTTSCLRCGERWFTRDVIARLDDEPDPRHAGCSGILKPDIVYFGELLPDEALLAVVAADAGAELIVVNDQPTQYDDLATRIVRDPIDEAVSSLVTELLAR